MNDAGGTLASRLSAFLGKPWRELALFSLMVMESCWVVALFVVAVAGDRPDATLRSALVFGSIYFGVHVLVRVMNHYQIRTRIRRIVLGILFIASIQIALLALLPPGENPSILSFITDPFKNPESQIVVPIHFWIMLAVTLLWLRSVRLARYPVGSDLTLNAFKFGMVMWLLYGILSLVAEQTRAPWILFLFLFAGLVSMSAGRLTEISGMRGGRQVRFHRAWAAGIGVSTLVVVGTGFLLSRLLQGELGGVAEVIVILFVGLIILLLGLLVSPLLILFLVILPKIEEIFSGVNAVAKIKNISDQLMQIFQPLFKNERLQAFFRTVWATRGIFMLTVIIILAVLVLAGTRWWKNRQQTSAEDQLETILSGREMLNLLRDSLRNRLQTLVDRLRGRGPLPDARRLLAAMRIRWIYYQMAEMAAGLGQPRPAAATPLEYQPTVEALFPVQAADVGAITHAYLQVRYGEIPEREEEIQAVNDAWQRIEAEGRPRLGLIIQEEKKKKKNRQS